MRKAQSEKRLIMLAGVIVISLLAIVFVVRVVSPSLESSREGQAAVMANMIAISVNTLSTMDAGQVTRDFSMGQGSQPMTVEVYDKDKKGVMFVKITYDDKGGFYETPLLVTIDPVPPVRLNTVYVTKDISGKIYVNGGIAGGWEMSTPVDMCLQPSVSKINEYIAAASGKYGVDANLVKAVITQESYGGCQCTGCKDGGSYLRSSSGAVGLMQVMPSTATSMGAKQEDVYIAQNNVMLGTRYLADQLRTFGSAELALAAYNAGPGWLLDCPNCRGCMKACGLTTKSDWQAIKGCTCLPDQTRDYVPAVIGYRDNCYARNTCAQVCKLCS